MAKPPVGKLYLYEKPFVIDDTVANQQTHGIGYLDEDDRDDVKKINALILKFVIEEKLVDRLAEGGITPSKTDVMSSWQWYINHTNFRSLSDMTQYGRLMESLQMEDGVPINRLLDLHAKLGSGFDVRVLNNVVNRIIRSFQLVPYEVPTDHATVSWDTIHAETPFIWLAILCQIVIQSASIKD